MTVAEMRRRRRRLLFGFDLFRGLRLRRIRRMRRRRRRIFRRAFV